MGNYWSHPKHYYGWKHDKNDDRDFIYKSCLTPLPSSLSLRGKMPPVLDQLQLGSCTSNSICNAFRFDEIKQSLPNIERSRLFLYYNERVIDGDVNTDDGASIRDGIKSANTTGICSSDLWPYDITKFKEKPPQECYNNAKLNHTIVYQKVNQNLNDMKSALYSGYPIVIGFVVYTSMESTIVAQTGNVPMPSDGEQVLGGHAILLCGYDDDKQLFNFQNSWGTSWGDLGFGTIPYAYVSKPELASDFWIMEQVIESNNEKYPHIRVELKHKQD